MSRSRITFSRAGFNELALPPIVDSATIADAHPDGYANGNHYAHAHQYAHECVDRYTDEQLDRYADQHLDAAADFRGA